MSNVIEEVTLNWTDLTGKKTGASKLGSNKFYKATITDNGGSFTVTFNYGRVGSAGQTQTVQCGTVDDAKRQMEKKVKAKISKGYTRVEMRSEDEEKAKAKAQGVDVGDKKKKKKAKKRSREFHPQVDGLVRFMYSSTGKAIAKGLSSAAGASEDAPLGNLSDAQLDKGADILDELEKLAEKKRKPKKDKFIDLTNDYLSNIPRDIDYARKGGRLDLDQIVIDTQERIDEQRQFITLLRDAFLQKEVFQKAAELDDPVEVWYEGLNCDIDAIDEKSDEFAWLDEMFAKGQSPKNGNFYGKLKLFRAWKLERNGEKDGFDEYAAKIKKKKTSTGIIHGWHGTKDANLMGISKSGLLMPENLPKGVHITGKAFGMGIYHAPRWPDAGDDRKCEDTGETYKRFNGALKSMNYTDCAGAYWNSASSGRKGFMFLEEIALGTPEVHLTACWGKDRPAKGKDYIYAKAFGNPQLAHDEIVTFEENAQRMTHLLEIGHKK